MYTDNQKALIILSNETSIKRKLEKLSSVDNARELYDDYSKADEMIELMKEYKVKAICLGDEDYPQLLADIYDPPVVLYCRGNIQLLKEKDKIAVVGTRRPTRYGKDVVIKFIHSFVDNNVVVVSGLARGIDTYAHKETLTNNGKTIAVVANGLDQVYPSENLDITKEIIINGLLISEYPLGTPPMSFRFPERNRIISGLCKAVFIPEAGLNSGSLITASCAIDQGRELFVVPGSIFSAQSAGCNLKLKELQASIVTCAEDIFGCVGVVSTPNLSYQLTIEQQRIVEILEQGEVHFVDLLDKSQLKINEISALLTEMEIYGIIRKLAGNYYCLTPQ